MATPLNKNLKETLDRRFAVAISGSTIGADELTNLKRVVAEQCRTRHQGMIGDNIEAHCFEQTISTIDIAAICPMFYAAIKSEFVTYREVAAYAQQGLAYANVLSRRLLRAKPELETLEALVQRYVREIKDQLRG